MILVENIVSQETLQKFKLYERLLTEWNRRTILVQQDTLPDFYHRHILDSLQLIPIIHTVSSLPSLPSNQNIPSLSPVQLLGKNREKWDREFGLKDTLSIVDLGSGAGFPGMVLAMCGFKKVTLCESNQKKCFFLEEVARQTKTDVAIVHGRIENMKEKFDLFVSRACMDLERALGMMMLLSSNPLSSFALFHKGRSWKKEVSVAQEKWSFSGQFIESITAKEGVVLYLHHLEKKKV